MKQFVENLKKQNKTKEKEVKKAFLDLLKANQINPYHKSYSYHQDSSNHYISVGLNYFVDTDDCLYECTQSYSYDFDCILVSPLFKGVYKYLQQIIYLDDISQAQDSFIRMCENHLN